MEQAVLERLREALLTVTALKASMEHAVRSDPTAVWKHWSYWDYMRKYNDVVAYVRTLVPITAPIDVYNLEKVRHPGDMLMPEQKGAFRVGTCQPRNLGGVAVRSGRSPCGESREPQELLRGKPSEGNLRNARSRTGRSERGRAAAYRARNDQGPRLRPRSGSCESCH